MLLSTMRGASWPSSLLCLKTYSNTPRNPLPICAFSIMPVVYQS